MNGVAPKVLSLQEYDERNLLKSKKLHQASGGGYLQTLDYTYNIQGWVSRLNDPASLGSDLFGFELVYKEGDASLDSRYASGQNANYAGNITLMKWNVQGSSNVKTYGFLYDNLNRLKEGIYAEKTSGGSYTASGNYANALTYDRDGNILTQTRTGRKGDGTFNQIDNMTYTYNSKGQLSTLRDNSDGTKGFVTPTPGTAQGYTYDNAGNLTRDEHKKITISYNALNLPRRILFDNGSQIDITYDAAGNKLKKQVIYPNGDRNINNLPISSGTYTASGTITSTGRVDNGSNVTFKAGTAVLLNPGFETKPGAAFLGKTETGQSANYTQDYVMGIEYQNTVMQAIYNSEGRLYFTGSTTRYEYTMTDHLGNARVSFTDQNADGTPEIIQENHYYPFGLAMEGPWVNDPAEDNKYQYNGKELNDDFGLGWMDYGARWYDAAIGRWSGIDPLAEEYRSWNPYNYVYNDPMSYIDPDGRSGIGTIGKDKDGNPTITIHSHFYVYGSGASPENAKKLAEQIQTLWNAAGGTRTVDGVKYKVQFNITSEVVSTEVAADKAEENDESPNFSVNFARIETDFKDASRTDRLSGIYANGSNSMILSVNELENGTTAAHEYGHGLGLLHPGSPNKELGFITEGQPGIMTTTLGIFDLEYTQNPSALERPKVIQDDKGKRIDNPLDKTKRVVLPVEVKSIYRHSTSSGKVNFGGITNIVYSADGKFLRRRP